MERESLEEALYGLQQLKERVDRAMELLNRLARVAYPEEEELLRRSLEHLARVKEEVLRLEGRMITLRDLWTGYPSLFSDG